MKAPFKSALVVALLIAASAARAQTTTVIVVRHAEKAAEPAADPPLNAAGAARAELLADMVRDAGVSAIITTQFQRTRMTGAPAAARLGITAEVVDARAPMHAKAVADSVLTKHRGQTVLVVGHSNTVPDIVAALGAPKPAPLCDEAYDNAFLVTIPSSGPATALRLHYGQTTFCKAGMAP